MEEYVLLSIMGLCGGYLAYFVYQKFDKEKESKPILAPPDSITSALNNFQSIPPTPNLDTQPTITSQIPVTHPSSQIQQSTVTAIPQGTLSSIDSSIRDYAQEVVDTISDELEVSNNEKLIVRTNGEKAAIMRTIEEEPDWPTPSEEPYTGEGFNESGNPVASIDEQDSEEALSEADQEIDKLAEESMHAHSEFGIPCIELFEAMQAIGKAWQEVVDFIEECKQEAFVENSEEGNLKLEENIEFGYRYFIEIMKDKKLFHLYGYELKEMNRKLTALPSLSDPSVYLSIYDQIAFK